jgi:two-component system, OmpR family, response regulator ResD
MASKILVVDDDVDLQNQMKMMLEAAGYEVQTADGYSTAKVLLEEYLPDLAIIDMMLEETDGGLKLAYHLKKKTPDLPVIMVSSVTSRSGLEFDAITNGERTWLKADAFLAKPVRFEQLQREIKRLLPGVA